MGIWPPMGAFIKPPSLGVVHDFGLRRIEAIQAATRVGLKPGVLVDWP
jgi:hypothetical protein